MPLIICRRHFVSCRHSRAKRHSVFPVLSAPFSCSHGEFQKAFCGYRNFGLAGPGAQSRKLGDGPFVLKDHIMSVKHRWDEACFVQKCAGREQIESIAEALREE